MVDTVASLGSVPFFVDSWEIDACYTGGQKCISGPPGISPLTFSPLAMKKIRGRKSPVANWYLDATLLSDYWIPPTPGSGGVRKYHHTPPTNLIYALREAVLLVAEEGLENVWKRHQEATDALYTGSYLPFSCFPFSLPSSLFFTPSLLYFRPQRTRSRALRSRSSNAPPLVNNHLSPRRSGPRRSCLLPSQQPQY
jgi:aspartate aminotransferase-like enzyme